MPDILSQNQIDNLLKNLNSGSVDSKSDSGVPGKKIKEYDFRSPKKFTKEQLRTMDSLHENLSRLVSSYFSGSLRTFCEATVLQIEEQRYYEFNNALPDSSLIGLLEVKPHDKNINESTFLLDLAPNIAYFMIDRLLGGTGNGNNFSRDFTEIELSIMDHEYRKLSRYIQESWRDYIDVEMSLGSIETNTRLIQIYAPEDIVVIVAINIKLKDIQGVLTICIPAAGLEEMMGDFVSKYTRMSRRLTDDKKEQVRKHVIMDNLFGSELQMKAVFHEMEIDLHELLQLQVDDIIPFNKMINGKIQLQIDDVPWFAGKLGSVKNKKAVEIDSMLDQ